MRFNAIASVAALAATAAGASIAPVPAGGLPPEHHAGIVTYVTGGAGGEAGAWKHAAREFPLELVFIEKDNGKSRWLADMPVTITDAHGKVVFAGPTGGTHFLARLPRGRYTVKTRWDGWTFSRPFAIGSRHRRVVFTWLKGTPPKVG